MMDLVERLRNNERSMGHGYRDVDPMSNEAADTIEALRAENARLYEWKDKAGDMDRVKTVELVDLRAENAKLREALKPFAELAQHTGSMSDMDGVCVYVEDLRAARSAMGETDKRINQKYKDKRLGESD